MSFKKMCLILSSFFIVSCTSIKENPIVETESSKIMNSELTKSKDTNSAKFLEVYDPLEPLNRRFYYFNYHLDKYVLIPAVNTYEYITPNFAQKGVSNFFANLQEINTFFNSILQFEGKKATITLTRFGINSTFGVLGLLDVATTLELPKAYEDFGLTLAKYGVRDGPYLVLPALGPSNLRDTTGKAVGMITVAEVNPYQEFVGVDINHIGVDVISSINARQENKSFRYYGTGTPFEYEYVRYLYTKYRETLAGID